MERLDVPGVPGLVRLKFLFPEIYSTFRHPGKSASLVPVPETSIDENNLSASTEHYIWFAREVFAMKSVAVSKTMDKASNQHLRAGVLAMDSAHYFAAFFLAKCVHFSPHGYFTPDAI